MLAKRYIFVVAALFLAAGLSGCAARNIDAVKSDPYRYADDDVWIKGEVTRHFGILGTGAYEIEDPSGKITVISKRGVPSVGSTVRVKGNTLTVFQVSGVDHGTVFQEKERKAQ